MNLWLVIPLLLAFAALRFLRPPILAWLAAWWIGAYVALKWGFRPPLPGSIVGMFMAILTFSLAAYGSADAERLASIVKAARAFFSEKRFVPWQFAALVLIPLAFGFAAWQQAARPAEPPANVRTIHPAPPGEISFRGRKMDLLHAGNPYRELETKDPGAFAGHVEKGRAVYYRNCVFCHGDNLRGDGIYGHGFDPQPADFGDPTTIAMLQESYLFWRIAKGGPGLPEESTPWASAMPAWEPMLQEDEIWDVISFLYAFTGRKPRAQERAE
jgi:mono/diheme cytochrome c family protein